jgi:hypothetical protein
MGSKVKIILIKAYNSIGIIERYHGLIRRAYSIIIAKIPGISKDMALQMAFKAINDIAGPNRLVPTLLVYGAYPRITEHDPPSPSIAQRALAIKKAMAEVQKLRAKRQVNDAINTRNGPSTATIHDLTLNSNVLVWREGNTGQSGSWEGPYKLITVNGESCILALPHGNTTFRSTSVKPYFTNTEVEPAGEESSAIPLPLPVKRGRGRPRRNPDITIFL